MPSVNVTINGKNYRMACDDGQEGHLESLAKQLDAKVHMLKGSFGDIGDQRLVVMAGIMTSDELVDANRKLKALEEELARIKSESISQNRVRKDGDHLLVAEIENAAKAIERLSAKLDAAGN